MVSGPSEQSVMVVSQTYILCSKHVIFLVTYKWAQKARVFVLSTTFQPSVMYHFSFLGPFISYKENEAL
jgi:hypothetical protein